MMSLKIYFGGSIRAGRQDVHIYNDIITQLKAYGEVLTEFVGDKKVTESGKDAQRGLINDKEIHDDDVAMLSRCDCFVAEVTQPSLGVGYEIGRAVEMNKTILCLYRCPEGKSLSAMIRGAHNGTTFQVVDYKDISEVPGILKTFFEKLA